MYINTGALLKPLNKMIKLSCPGVKMWVWWRSCKSIQMGGFTLVELALALAIVGTLSAIAIPFYGDYMDKADETTCIADLEMIEKRITIFFLEYNDYPASLADIGMDSLKDPWGNSYEYLRVRDAEKGKLRKDHFMVPVNSDFDLYSKGEDGKSSAPFTSALSRDDIARANDGDFIGKVSDY